MYYLKNRKKILARTRDYRRKYAKDYYYRKKAEKISAERAQAALEMQSPSGLKGPVLAVEPSVTPDGSPAFNDPLPSLEE